MKKKKIIISICLVLILSMSAFVAVHATSGEENIFETLKALITGNTNRIEKLENKVGTLENEVDKLKGEITELQKPKEEKGTETEEKNSTTTSNSNKKPTTNTTTKKPSTTTSNNTTKKTTTTDYQKQIDTLNKEIETLNKKITDLETTDNDQTAEIESLKNELDNKSKELEELTKSNNTSNVLTKEDIIGSWNYDNGSSNYNNAEYTTYTFNDNNTATIVSQYKLNSVGMYGCTSSKTEHKDVANYTYTLEDNHIRLTLVSATTQLLGGTGIVKDYTTGKEETIEIKAEEPVDNYTVKQQLLSIQLVNNSLYINGAAMKFVKNK